MPSAAGRGQMDARHVDQSLRQQGEGLLAGSLEGEQAKTVAAAEFVGQQPDGRIAGGNHQGVRRRGRELLAKLPFLADAVMADDPQIGRLGGIDEFASGNRGPPVAAGLTVRLPGPGRLAGSRRSELKEVLDAAIQRGGQGQGGGGRRHQPVGLDRADPGARDPRPGRQIVLGPSPRDAARSYSIGQLLVQRTWQAPIPWIIRSLADRKEQGWSSSCEISIAADPLLRLGLAQKGRQGRGPFHVGLGKMPRIGRRHDVRAAQAADRPGPSTRVPRSAICR